MAFGGAYCPDGKLELDEIEQIETGIEVQISSTTGGFRLEVDFKRPDRAMLHYKTMIDPVAPLLIPFWPRDVIPLGKEDNLTDSEGIIYAKQVGPRSSLVYFSLIRRKCGSVLYFQNLTCLSDYWRWTETSLSGMVGGEWPELGLALPAAADKTLAADQDIAVSDTYIIFSPQVPKDDLVMRLAFSPIGE